MSGLKIMITEDVDNGDQLACEENVMLGRKLRVRMIELV